MRSPILVYKGKAKVATMLETILNSPGLQHLAKEIFWNLNSDALEACSQVNQSSKQILENPFFWLEKLVRMGVVSKKNQEDWIKAIQSVKNSDEEKNVLVYLKWNFKKDGLVDLPCYTSPIVQDEFRKKIWQSCLLALPNRPFWPGPFIAETVVQVERMKKLTSESNDNIEMLKILAPLTNNPNAPMNNGDTPIHVAAFNGHTEIVKILAPLTDNPNAPNMDGRTPLHWAAHNGHKEIVKVLAPYEAARRGPSTSCCIIL